MRRVLILVEGPTEERFVGSILRDHLLARSLLLIPTILVTKFRTDGPRNKGGVGSWNQIERDLKRLLGDTNAAGITTMLDYYGLPLDVPGMANRPPRGTPLDRVSHVEQSITARMNHGRFYPFLVLHELEALLFTSIDSWAHHFEDAAAIAQLKHDVAGLEPEAINETPDGAPSRRIKAHLGAAYRKVLHGPLAAADIGLEAIRAACPHFASWLAWLESLGDPAT